VTHESCELAYDSIVQTTPPNFCTESYYNSVYKAHKARENRYHAPRSGLFEDTQAKSVYASERLALCEYNERIDFGAGTTNTQSFVDWVVNAFPMCDLIPYRTKGKRHAVPIILENSKNKNSYAVSEFGCNTPRFRIRMGACAYRAKDVLLHELAHTLTWRYYAKPHGPEFCGFLVYLCAEYLDKAYAGMLLQNLIEKGVPVDTRILALGPIEWVHLPEILKLYRAEASHYRGKDRRVTFRIPPKQSLDLAATTTFEIKDCTVDLGPRLNISRVSPVT